MNNGQLHVYFNNQSKNNKPFKHIKYVIWIWLVWSFATFRQQIVQKALVLKTSWDSCHMKMWVIVYMFRVVTIMLTNTDRIYVLELPERIKQTYKIRMCLMKQECHGNSLQKQAIIAFAYLTWRKVSLNRLNPEVIAESHKVKYERCCQTHLPCILTCRRYHGTSRDVFV